MRSGLGTLDLAELGPRPGQEAAAQTAPLPPDEDPVSPLSPLGAVMAVATAGPGPVDGST